jgi:hypothetical protein
MLAVFAAYALLFQQVLAATTASAALGGASGQGLICQSASDSGATPRGHAPATTCDCGLLCLHHATPAMLAGGGVETAQGPRPSSLLRFAPSSTVRVPARSHREGLARAPPRRVRATV